MKTWTTIRKVIIPLPLYLPEPLVAFLHRFRDAFRGSQDRGRARDLCGDREVEWSWIVANMPLGPGKALDFGTAGSDLGLVAAERGYSVTALDIQPVRWLYRHPSLRFLRGDILSVPIHEQTFDLIINCSSIEHVGLAGRYGINESRPEGDLEAMERMHKMMTPGGIMLITVPVGQDATFPPWHRVYGGERLPRLLHGFELEIEAFWMKDKSNRWQRCNRDVALAVQPLTRPRDPVRSVYALGCFVLRKPAKRMDPKKSQPRRNS